MKRSDADTDYLAEKVPAKPERVAKWETGEERPTFKQAQNIARILHIPFGYLFLRKIPGDEVPIPDLRTVGDRAPRELSIDLKQVVRDVLRKQDWYRDYLIDQGSKHLAFVGRFTTRTSPKKIADDISATLRLTIADRNAVSNWEGFLDLLMRRAEEVGIWVLRSGIVGNNTHRGLDVEEFRGYAICDDIIPLVFINGSDAQAAQIFTLVHELAHIWLGESGISNPQLSRPNDPDQKRVETLCNKVAAEVLVPAAELQKRWNHKESISTNADDLARFFRVSSVVIARRAYELKAVSWEDYNSYYGVLASRWKKDKEDKPGGGDFYRTQPIKNGRKFTSAVLHSAYDNQILLRDAGKLLGVNPAKIGKLAEQIGVK